MIDQGLMARMHDALQRDPAYGRRAASRWLCEALVSLADGDPSLAQVGLGEGIEGRPLFDQLKTLNLTPDADKALASAITIVRLQDPLQEGVQSQVIRAAIRVRLQRGA